jgi:two-component system chemotaxis response regulator CheY
LKLISAVRAMPQHADVPIVVITTEGAQKDRDRAMGLGASWYMVKPVQAPDVIVVVKELLNLTE